MSAPVDAPADTSAADRIAALETALLDVAETWRSHVAGVPWCKRCGANWIDPEHGNGYCAAGRALRVLGRLA